MSEVFDVDRLDHLLQGRRVGLACTPAAWIPGRGALADALAGRCRLAAFLALEHGLRGERQDGVHIDACTDARSGLPVFSFYGAEKTVPPAFFRAVDVVLFCAQDVSHRAYTFHWALASMLEAAARAQVPVLVLDRPSPLAHLGVQGAIGRQFFPLAFPLLPGLTLGELARWLVAEERLSVELEVIALRNWQRHDGWAATGLPWIPPSPNIPTLDSAYAYACTGILQATTASEGRGTCKPFEYIGAPFLDGAALARGLNARRLSGIEFREVQFQPGFSKFTGQLCGGVHLLITDYRSLQPIRVMFTILQELARLCPAEFALTAGFADWLDGDESWSSTRLASLDLEATLEADAAACAKFRGATEPFRLYPD